MPTPIDAMLGLVVASIGLLTLVIAMTVPEDKRRFAYGISALICITGLGYFASSEIRGAAMRRRIENLQRQQQVNIEEIQKQMQDAQSKGTAKSAPKPDAKPQAGTK